MKFVSWKTVNRALIFGGTALLLFAIVYTCTFSRSCNALYMAILGENTEKFTPRDLAAAAPLEGAYYLIGGVSNFEINQNDVWRSVDGARWVPFGNIPGPDRQRHGAFAVGLELHVVAGCNHTECLNDEIILSGREWRREKLPFSGRGGIAVFQGNKNGKDEVLIAGGHDYSGVDLPEIFARDELGGWVQVGELDVPKKSFGSISKMGDTYYYFSDQIYSSKNLKSWVSSGIHIPLHAAIFEFGGYIFVVGGLDSTGRHVNAISKFDGVLLSEYPSNLPSLMSPRRAMSIAKDNKRIIMMGGYKDDKTACSKTFSEAGLFFILMSKIIKDMSFNDDLKSRCEINSRKYFNDVFVAEDPSLWNKY